MLTFRDIAGAARREMESFAEEHSHIGCTESLACYCAISSYFLVRLAGRLKFKATLVEGIAFEPDNYSPSELHKMINHCWTEFDGRVYDITATQFDNVKKVHVVQIPNPDYVPVRKGDAARKAIFDSSWEEWGEQSPVAYLDNLNARVTTLGRKLRRQA